MKKKKIINKRLLERWEGIPQPIKSLVLIFWKVTPKTLQNFFTNIIGVPPEPKPPEPKPPKTPKGKPTTTTERDENDSEKSESRATKPFSPPSSYWYYPRKTLFTNPDPKIFELQKQVLESLFYHLDLSIDKHDKTIFSFPSRLMGYLKKQDAFSAFGEFLIDVGLNTQFILKDQKERDFLKQFLIAIFDVDVCRWGTNLSDQPFYNLIANTKDFDQFYQLLEHLDNCAFLIRGLESERLSIPFYDFQRFKEAVILKLKYWEKVTELELTSWFNLIEEYKLAYENFNKYWDSINNELKRLEKIELTDAENQVINSLIREAEEVNHSLEEGSTDVVNGLTHLEELTDTIMGFVDEIFMKRKESSSSSKEIETKDDLREVYWALKIFGLTSLETLTLKELKSLYRSTARKVHPDVGGRNEDMINLSDAYDILRSYLERK